MEGGRRKEKGRDGRMEGKGKGRFESIVVLYYMGT